MKRKNKNPLTAKQVAMMDITEDCRKTREGRNYIPYEKDILESLGIIKGDFRQFNGGHHPKKK